jgi:hypothetical protein
MSVIPDTFFFHIFYVGTYEINLTKLAENITRAQKYR